MGFSDIFFLVIFCFIFVVVVLTGDYVYSSVMPHIEDDIPNSTNTSIQSAWANNRNFADQSFAAIFFIFALISIGLTIFLASHPFVLVAWLFFNIVTLFVYDVLIEDFMTVFLGSDINTGNMSNAVAFLQGDFPKAIVIINVLLGGVLFGKRAGAFG